MTFATLLVSQYDNFISSLEGLGNDINGGVEARVSFGFCSGSQQCLEAGHFE